MVSKRVLILKKENQTEKLTAKLINSFCGTVHSFPLSDIIQQVPNSEVINLKKFLIIKIVNIKYLNC